MHSANSEHKSVHLPIVIILIYAWTISVIKHSKIVSKNNLGVLYTVLKMDVVNCAFNSCRFYILLICRITKYS